MDQTDRVILGYGVDKDNREPFLGRFIERIKITDLTADKIAALQEEKDFLFIVWTKNLKNTTKADSFMSQLYKVVKPPDFQPTREQSIIISKFKGKISRNRKEYEEIVKDESVYSYVKKYFEDNKIHMKSFLLCDVLHSGSKWKNYDMAVMWLPTDRKPKKNTVFGTGFKDEGFGEIAKKIGDYNKSGRTGFMEKGIHEWVHNSKNNGEANMIYAAVARIEKQRGVWLVYVGRASGYGLASRWKVARTKSAVPNPSHILQIQNFLRHEQSDGPYCDLVFSAAISKWLKSQIDPENIPSSPSANSKVLIEGKLTEKEKKLPFTDPVESGLDLYLFPVEHVPNSDDLNDREAHWTFTLGGFDQEKGLNVKIDKFHRDHAKRCKECCEILHGLVKTKESSETKAGKKA